MTAARYFTNREVDGAVDYALSAVTAGDAVHVTVGQWCDGSQVSDADALRLTKLNTP